MNYEPYQLPNHRLAEGYYEFTPHPWARIRCAFCGGRGKVEGRRTWIPCVPCGATGAQR